MLTDAPFPTTEHIEALHHKYAPSENVFILVYTHSRIVYDIARQLADRNHTAFSPDILRVGSLLHDIGVYAVLGKDGRLKPGVSYIAHGIQGEKILQDEGLPETIWRIASHHTGAGLTRHDVVLEGLPLPMADFLAETPEERLIMYADKFHSKTTPPMFNSLDWYRRHVSHFGPDKTAAFEALVQEFGAPDLAPLMTTYNQDQRI